MLDIFIHPYLQELFLTHPYKGIAISVLIIISFGIADRFVNGGDL